MMRDPLDYAIQTTAGGKVMLSVADARVLQKEREEMRRTLEPFAADGRQLGRFALRAHRKAMEVIGGDHA